MNVRGRLKKHAKLGELTWFGCGGTADLLFKPKDTDDLADFLRQLPAGTAITCLGAGSNVLIRDGGIRGAVIRMGAGFNPITINDNVITAGAASLCANAALLSAEHGLTGLEFLSGIPGSIGGVLAMNAGAYGVEVKDILIDVTVMDRHGNQHTIPRKDLTMTYRQGGLNPDWIVLSARLQAQQGDKEQILARIAEIKQSREDSQPTRGKTGGSTFTNPTNMAAWKLVDDAGCRGLKLGGAQVSTKHSNFLLNVDNASAADVEGLGELVRQKVLDHSGVRLEWEIRRIGEKV